MKYTILAALLLPFCGSQFAVPPANAQVDPLVLASALPLTAAPTVPASTRARVLEKYAHLPLRFEANQGQTDQRVRFLSRGSGYTLFLTPTEAVVSVSEPAGGLSDPKRQGFSLTHNRISTLRMELFGAKTDATIAGSEELPGRSNYFIGNDPHQWHTHIPAFARVNYKDIYPGVDLVYYGNQRQLEYDFVVAPGADPNRIRLKISSSHQIRIDQNGDVLIGVGTRDFRLGAPTVYQEYEGKHHSVDGKWIQSKRHELQFGLGAYDHSRALIVDPTLALVYSTFLGGSAKDEATGVAVDPSGNAYITGSTASGGTIATVPFPTTPGAYQPQCNGCTGNGTNNVFVSEIDPTGTILQYSTFLGGSNGDGANGIAVDASGAAYIVGTTFSGGGGGGIAFPTTTGAFQTVCAGGCTNGDAFVSEIAPGGGSLTFSTFLGGTGKDTGNAIALDINDKIYVVGSTSSTDFPLQSPFQATNAGGTSDAFVARFTAEGSTLDYSTYLGGTLEDVAYAIAVDDSSNAYIAGVTYSTDFPTVNPLQSANAGNGDGFVAKLNNTGGGLTYSTYLGGSALDQINGIALDSSNDAYTVGTTSSSNFPTKNPFQSACASCSVGPSDAFVSKIDTAGSALVYSTFLGGSGAELGFSVAVDSVGNAFVSGQTASTDFPVANYPNYAFQTCSSCSSGGTDGFVTEFDVAGNALVYSSYLGGTTSQSAYGIKVNLNDQAIVAGATASSNFPVTSGVVQSTYGGGTEDAFLTSFPAAANCTNSYTQADIQSGGSTINITLSCNGNFFLGNTAQFLGYEWGDNTEETGSGDGCPASTGCIVTTGNATFPASHPYASNGSYSGTNTVTDGSGNNIITTGFSVTIPLISMAPANLPGGAVGTAYSQTLTGSGGTAPYTWSVTSGSLAPLTLGSTTGVISGTPTTAGTLSFTVQAKDTNGNTTPQAFSIVVSPVTLKITTTSLPGGTVGTAYSQTLAASGGTTPYTWSITAGSLAPLTLGSTTGTISGTPTTAGTLSFTVQVKDANSNTATQALSIVVSPTALKISTTSLPGGTVGTPYSQTVTASGGTTPYTWSITSGSLAPLTLASTTGVISGTPTTAGTLSFTVQVKDANSNTATQALSIVVSPAALTITTTSLPYGIVGTAYSQTVTASGGTTPYTWSVSAGSLAPLTLGSTTGVISGTPTTVGTLSFTLQVKDANSKTATQALSIIVSPTTLTITTTSLPGGTVGSAYSQTLAASGGTTPYTWSVSAGSVAPLTLGSTTGTISGTPTAAGTLVFTVQVKDANSNTATQALSIVVSSPALKITTTSLPGGTVGTAYSQTLAASGGTTPYTWSVSAGSLAPLTLGSTTGTISGTPTAAGTLSFTTQVKDANSNTATQALSIVVTSAVAPPTCAAPTITAGTNSLAVTATSNCTDSGSTISSTSFDWGDDSAASSGTSGSHTYAASGTFTITVTATNANNLTSSASATITVTAPLTTPVQQGQAATQTANVVAPPGGDITVTYACTSADGPNGTQPLSTYFLSSCTVLGPNNSSTVNLTSTPQAVTVSVNTAGPTASQSAARSGRVGGLYSAFLFLPGIALLGVGCSRRGRGKVGQYASLALLGLMMMGWLACGGGTIAPPPPQNVTPPGTYGINITGTSSTGTTVTVTVGFTVTIG